MSSGRTDLPDLRLPPVRWRLSSVSTSMIYEGVGEVDVVDLLETIGVENVRHIGRGEVAFSCPFTDGHAFGDSNPSNHMNEEKLVYRCKGCGRAGTVIDLIAAVQHVTAIQAMRLLRERYGDTYRPPEGGTLAKEMELRAAKKTAKAKPHRYPTEEETIGPQGIFHFDWDSDTYAGEYMLEKRGFTKETLEFWQIGYDHWTNRITIPVRDEHGKLIGFKGRALDPNAPAKYTLLGDTEERKPRFGVGYGFDMHDPRHVVFGLDRVVDREQLVVCEGELNVMACHQAGVMTAVAIGTTYITEEQQRLLRWYADSIVLFYDSDEAGTASTWGYYYDKDGKQIWQPGLVEKLGPFVRILVAPDHDGDPASMSRQEILDCVKFAQPWRQIAIA
jgi:DNA primase